MKDVLKYQHPDSDLALIFDDDDDCRVAYAYLSRGRGYIADVWLYNHGSAPQRPEWKDGPGKMPFRNPAKFVDNTDFEPITRLEDIEVRWPKDADGNFYAELFLRGKLHARLKPGDKPGECVLALKDGPIARILRKNEPASQP
jgi:hypothetical protein